MTIATAISPTTYPQLSIYVEDVYRPVSLAQRKDSENCCDNEPIMLCLRIIRSYCSLLLLLFRIPLNTFFLFSTWTIAALKRR